MQKIRNATKVSLGGILFASKLEAYMYNLLKEAGFEFGYEAEKWEIFNGFMEPDGTKVRGIVYTPDFIVYFKDLLVIVETKGRANDSWALRLKLIKKHMAMTDRLNKAKFLIPKNQQQCREVADILIHYRDTGEYIEWVPDKSRRQLKDAKDKLNSGRVQSDRGNKLLSTQVRERRAKSPKREN